MLNGIHGPNRGYSPSDYEVMRWGRFQSVKLWVGAEHNPALASELLRAFPGIEIVLRTSDLPTPFSNFPASMVERWFVEIGSFYHAGVRLFQVDNEPQYTWDTAQTRVTGPYNYQFWYRIIIQELRDRLNKAAMGDALLITAPLSWSPAKWRLTEENPYWTLDDWKAAYIFTGGGKVAPVVRLGDCCGANVYWQDPPQPEPPTRIKQRFDPSYGRSFEWYNDVSGKGVVITEYGNSLHEHQNPAYTPQQVEQARKEQYPEWSHWMQQFEYVHSAHVFISPGAINWDGFLVGNEVARALGKCG